MQFELTGPATTVFLVAGFLLLLIGVYPSKQREQSVNLLKHGIFSSVATIVAVVMIFLAMIPTFIKIVSSAAISSFSLFPIMWIHASLGIITIALAIVMIFFWAKEPLSELGCSKTWRLMKPVVIVWAITLALGIILTIYGLR